MFGFQYFNNIFFLLSDSFKRRILEKIFSVQNIIEYYYFYRNSRLCFRIYANNSFYQFVFIFDYSDDDIFLRCFNKEKIFCCYIYAFDYYKLKEIEVSPLVFLINILLSCSELEIYRFFPNFL